MADNPTSSLSHPLSGADTIAPPLQNPNISSPSMDISSPHVLPPQIDSQPPQQQQQQQQMSSIPNFQSQQRSASSQIARLQQQYGSAAAVSAMRQHAGLYGGQVNFGGPQLPQTQPQQQQGLLSQAQFSVQQQMLPQIRQKTGVVQGSQFHPASASGQTLQGIQSIGMMNSLGLKNMQLSPYAQLAQQRLNPGIRQAQSSQGHMGSSQKLPGQCISQASMNLQLPGIAQNGQAAMVQNPTLQQQWLKQSQMTVGSAGSPYQLQQQRQKQPFLQQQLQKSTPLNSRQISQLVQQQPQIISQQQQQLSNLQVLQPALLQQHQHLPSLQIQQQQLQIQQQQSPRVAGSANQKSLSLTGSQPEALDSGATTPGGSSSQGAAASDHFVGKRKIGDLVSQVDSKVKLDPEVEDLLLELADNFIDQVTVLACTLAKHRKSSVLEPKDLLLHLEKRWNLSIPGYTEEKKIQRTQVADDIHKRRLEMIQVMIHSELPAADLNSSNGHPKPNLHESSIEGAIRSASSDQLISTTSFGTAMMKVQ